MRPASATGTVGIYEVLGIAGGTVNVTVANITAGADFNYTAGGCVSTFNGAGDGDSCTAISGGTPVAVVIANAADTVGNTGGANSGNPTPGATRIAIGGTITATAVHTAGQTLTESFTITVTY